MLLYSTFGRSLGFDHSHLHGAADGTWIKRQINNLIDTNKNTFFGRLNRPVHHASVLDGARSQRLCKHLCQPLAWQGGRAEERRY